MNSFPHEELLVLHSQLVLSSNASLYGYMVQSLNKFIQFNPAFKDALLAADYIAFAHNELMSFG